VNEHQRRKRLSLTLNTVRALTVAQSHAQGITTDGVQCVVGGNPPRSAMTRIATGRPPEPAGR
jgi:hypothetical protein